jgi:NADP-dependent 3-hydroxy acid dehydrogenase YdfG
MFKMIKQNLGGVDVCVNNAGMANAAPLLSGETNDWREMIDVSLNVHAN